jgi:Ca2+:H+ antiporter
MAYALLLFTPLSLALRYIFDAPPSWVFLTCAAAIAVLADWLRRATDQLAERAGSTIGGLLNISFGNTAELILALFVLSRAHTRIVQAQITGSIIGTTLPNGMLPERWPVGSRPGAAACWTTPLRRFRPFA